MSDLVLFAFRPFLLFRPPALLFLLALPSEQLGAHVAELSERALRFNVFVTFRLKDSNPKENEHTLRRNAQL